MIEAVLRDGVATLRLDDPATANALTPTVFAALTARIAALQAPDSGARALVITGSGRTFSSGANVDVLGATDPGALAEAITDSLLPLRRVLVEGRLPVIAAVNGIAVGGAVGLALLCDIVVATRSASFALVFAHLGLVPDTGLTQVLPRLIGEARARALLMSGATLSAEEAAAIGMIHRSIDDAQFTEAVEVLARQLAAMPAASHRSIRHAIAAGHLNDAEAQIRLEARSQAERVLSAEFREALSAFTRRRKPGR